MRSSLRTGFGTGLVIACLVVSTSASAATAVAEEPPVLSDQGNVILSAERVFGLTFSSTSTESDVGGTTSKNSTSYTNVGLLWGYPSSVYNIARFGLDYTVVDNVTIGFAGGFFSGSSKRKSEAGGQSAERDGPTVTSWLIAPRVGYIVDVSDKLSIWLRGGLTLFGLSQSSESTGATPTTSKDTISGVAVTAEPTFVVMPVPHFGLYGAVSLDFPVSGKIKDESTSAGVTRTTETDIKQSSYGATFGLVGYL